MSAQPIPGPYSFDPDAGSIESADGVIVATVSSVDSFPCRDTEKDEEFEGELAAAGRLLSAAPEMLVALKGAVDAWERHYSKFPVDTAVEDDEFGAMQAARAAIAKAEGRS